jgi:hypothetical protein
MDNSQSWRVAVAARRRHVARHSPSPDRKRKLFPDPAKVAPDPGDDPPPRMLAMRGARRVASMQMHRCRMYEDASSIQARR